MDHMFFLVWSLALLYIYIYELIFKLLLTVQASAESSVLLETTE